ncbi:DUF7124 domain-containing protein [Halomarina pelagica]|uniref:DUF7124 domain-containing protein n=1 Tax=Halomarina pelagica TaxID=2961599 RepID=UPI0020C30E7A|nr:hypothetical protein [Halomarina sp. BND7]
MTDRIDLDDLAGDDRDDSDGERNRGDWFWRGEGDPADEPDAAPSAEATGDDGEGRERGGDENGVDERADAGAEAGSGGPIPRVPRSNDDRPVGIPVERGGAGGATAERAAEREGATGDERSADDERSVADGRSGWAGHGGSEDPVGMTLAFTYEALRRLADPRLAVADAETWSDYVGIVGDVPAHVINTFQRTHGVDADFFNGTGTDAAERLAAVDPSSMFYAERMVLVGLPAEEGVAATAGWEFVPLATAAEKAGWELAE